MSKQYPLVTPETVPSLREKYGIDPDKIVVTKYDYDNNTEVLQWWETCMLSDYQDKMMAEYAEQQEQSYDPYTCKACGWPAHDGSGVCKSCAAGGIF